MKSPSRISPSGPKIDSSIGSDFSVRFFQQGVAAILIGLVTFLVVIRITAPEQTLRMVAPASGILLMGVIWWLIGRGRLQAAAILFASGAWLVAGAICVFYNGVHSAIVIVFPLLIVYAGWAISLRAAAVFTGLTVAFLIGLVAAEVLGTLPPPPPTPLAVFLVVQVTYVVVALILVGSLVWVYQRRVGELERERQFSAEIINSLPGMFYMFDANGRFVRWNRRFNDATTYTDVALAEMKAGDFFRGDDKERIAEAVRRVFADGHADIEADLAPGQGPAIPCRFTGVRATIGDESFLLGVAIDISENRRNQARLEEYRQHLEQMIEARTADLSIAKEAAEAANRAKSTFLANMSHELRTPMNAIMGMTSLAMRRTMDARLLDHLEKINQASHHLLAVINSILDISRIEAERLVLEQIDFSPAAVLDKLPALIGYKAVDKGLALELDVSPDVRAVVVCGDPMRVGQIVLNLADNAVKFTEHGKVTVRLRLAEDDAEQVLLRFEVEDTGIGISATDQKRVFAAFEQADGSMTRKYGGSGLGLAISRRLARLMGGDITVSSRPGEGSRFVFSLRLRKSAGAVAPAPTLEPGKAGERLQEEFSGSRILLAEDEPVNREVARTLLEAYGLVVDVAVDGVEAVSLARQVPYDLILMDMQMPNLNGVDATLAIRALPGHARTPILAMTANAFTEDRELCLAAGMDDHLPKPVEPQRLYEAVLTWLVRSRGTTVAV
ncbi:MAG: response regulator [Sulfuritalea sp.]|nr:response regulator [Sulfuritalea sp.]